MIIHQVVEITELLLYPVSQITWVEA